MKNTSLHKVIPLALAGALSACQPQMSEQPTPEVEPTPVKIDC